MLYLLHFIDIIVRFRALLFFRRPRHRSDNTRLLKYFVVLLVKRLSYILAHLYISICSKLNSVDSLDTLLNRIRNDLSP